jgi:signal transduction histidine kinase/DNA-binding response OmpR family regulator
MRDTLTWYGLQHPEIAESVEELRGETLRLLVSIAAVGYVAWHLLGAVLSPPERGLIYWALFPLVAIGLAGTHALRQRRSRIAVVWFLVSGVMSVTAAAWLFQSAAPLLFYPLLALAGVVLLNPFAGAAVGLMSTGLGFWLSRAGPLAFLESARLVETGVATVLAVVLAWTLGRCMIVAAGWALASYDEGRHSLLSARQHRAELVQALKQLDLAYHRLEQLSLELDRTRRAAEEARRLKDQFATAISHELRTPLNLILGFCEMMVLSPTSAYGHKLPATYRGDLEAMYRNASHLSALVDDILDLSQIDADRMALHREWASLAGVVAEAMTVVDSLFRKRDLWLRTTVSPDLPALYIDRTRVRQILINLLGNAARFAETGGVMISARVQNDAALVAVTDTGPGIAAGDLPHVFDEFRQVGAPESRPGGSGLGLAVSKRFAELHGGTMWAESTRGEGTTFVLSLPLVAEAATSRRVSSVQVDRFNVRLQGHLERRIAVFDDTGEILTVLRRYLDGYHVVDAAELQESLEPGRSEPLQAVVLGCPAAQRRWHALRRAAPELGSVPVVSCTLHTARRAAQELGTADYLVKPISREQLRTVVRRLPKKVESVLIVDDDTDMTRLLGRMMRSVAPGCRTRLARDGRVALELMRQDRPDLVLLDLLMPDTDGYAVLAAMGEDTELCDTSVVVVSARGLHDETVVASALGVSRENGLSVGEAMRWLKGGLDALLGPSNSAPASPAASTG